MSTYPVPLDPPGINAAGNVTLFWVPAIANPASGATLAELNAGTNISNALYAFDEGGEQSSNDRLKYGYRSARKSLGIPNFDIQPIEYDDDPQDMGGEEYSYLDILTEGAIGFIVHRRGLPPTTPFAADQKIDIRGAELGRQFRIAVVPGTEGDKVRIRQPVAIGDTWDDRVVLAS